jgi:hypothetical protein
MKKGFAGHRFTVVAHHQPPFVFKKTSTDAVGNIQISWEGIELRMLKWLAKNLNFTFDVREPNKPYLG